MTSRDHAGALRAALRWASLAAAFLLLASNARIAGAGEGQGTTGRAAGMMVHIDPATGAFLAEPPPPQPGAPAPRSALPAPAADLPVVAGDTPAGGITINLGGRFQQVMTAEKRPDGSIAVDCAPGKPAQKR